MTTVQRVLDEAEACGYLEDAIDTIELEQKELEDLDEDGATDIAYSLGSAIDDIRKALQIIQYD